MKQEKFDSHANILIACICLFPFLLGMVLGIFFVSPLDAKYLTVLIGAFAGILALAGVVYSKEKERILKEREIAHEIELNKLEIAHDKNKNKQDLLIKKTEELLNLLSKCFFALQPDIMRYQAIPYQVDDQKDLFIQINQIEFIHKAYEIGSAPIFILLHDHILGISPMSNEEFVKTYDRFRESIMKQTREKLL